MKILNSLEEWIISLMLLAMTGLTFLQVVMRYVFNSGFTWALELTTVFFAIMIFVGVSYGVRVGSHIGVDALVKLLSPAKLEKVLKKEADRMAPFVVRNPARPTLTTSDDPRAEWSEGAGNDEFPTA